MKPCLDFWSRPNHSFDNFYGS